MIPKLLPPWPERVAWAAKIAANAHEGQVDKHGTPPQPYILHPMRVAMSLADPNDPDAGPKMVVGFLHDVLEDCTDRPWERLIRLHIQEWNVEDALHVMKALKAITHMPKNEPNRDYIQRVVADPIARAVKIADIRDNMNRLADSWGRGVPLRDRVRLTQKYFDALEVLIPNVPAWEAESDNNRDFWSEHAHWMLTTGVHLLNAPPMYADER